MVWEQQQCWPDGNDCEECMSTHCVCGTQLFQLNFAIQLHPPDFCQIETDARVSNTYLGSKY